MLYMPTAAGSAKKHLLPTQAARKQALDYFCTRLSTDPSPELAANRDRIFFQTSTIEYDLYNKTDVQGEVKKAGDTATYWTLKELRATYNESIICLTMGLDNMFDLPFWANVHKYPEYVHGQIYVLQRDEEAEIETQTHLWIPPIKFNKFPSWHPKFKDGSIHQTPYEDSDLYARLRTEFPPSNTSLDSILKSISFVLLGKPAPTSSSLLRIALMKYYGTNSQPANAKYYNALKILASPHTPLALNDPKFNAKKETDPWYQSYIQSRNLENPRKLNSFDTNFNVKFPRVLAKGGKRATRKQRKIIKRRTIKCYYDT